MKHRKGLKNQGQIKVIHSFPFATPVSCVYSTNNMNNEIVKHSIQKHCAHEEIRVLQSLYKIVYSGIYD